MPPFDLCFCEFRTVSYSQSWAEEITDFMQSMLVFVLRLKSYPKETFRLSEKKLPPTWKKHSKFALSKVNQDCVSPILFDAWSCSHLDLPRHCWWSENILIEAEFTTNFTQTRNGSSPKFWEAACGEDAQSLIDRKRGKGARKFWTFD